jgi:hypothetical protein
MNCARSGDFIQGGNGAVKPGAMNRAPTRPGQDYEDCLRKIVAGSRLAR